MAPGKIKPKVAIVDNDAGPRSRLAALLRSSFEVVEGESFADAYQFLQGVDPLDVLLIDLAISPDGLGECIELLNSLSQSDLDTFVIVLSEDQKKATALRVVAAGAYAYFVKPIDLDVLRGALERASEELRLQRENRILREEVQRKKAFGDLIGSTEVMTHLFDSIRRVARGTTTVLIRGESGTGKELVARAIHEQSPRRNRSFVSVNCAALPENLMEAELFGYERGAFTGAVETKEGRIELANRGTLFLDEIGTLPYSLQSKLLRLLEERSLIRLGGKRQIRVDFRLLTATNEDLEEAVHQNRFREDLYYRINVVPIFLPPLRERIEDIPQLIDYFLQVYCAANGVASKRISDEAMHVLKNYPWPGNVRELENTVQRLVLMVDTDMISEQDLPPNFLQKPVKGRMGAFKIPSTGINLVKELDSFERRWVESALNQSNGVKAAAARLLGVDRNRMNYLCRKHSLES
jgi:DNA-binding NtrC family response regulator